MKRLDIGQKIERLMRIPFPGRNSLTACIEDSEYAKSIAIARSIEPSEENRAREGEAKENESNDAHGTACHPSDADSNDEVYAKIAHSFGKSMSYTIGILGISRRSLPMAWTSQFAINLANRSRRRTICIQVEGSRDSQAELLASPPQGPEFIQYDSWDLTSPRSAYSAAFQAGIRQLPSLKSRFPLVLLDLGKVGRPWVEPLGRMCDAVYVIVPNQGALTPSSSKSHVLALVDAAVPIRGSWVADVA